MMGSYGGGMTGFAWMGMGLFWLALLGLIVWLVVRLFPGKPHDPKAVSASPTALAAPSVAAPALAILDERLANGEIDLDKYRTIRAALVENREGER